MPLHVGVMAVPFLTRATGWPGTALSSRLPFLTRMT